MATLALTLANGLGPLLLIDCGLAVTRHGDGGFSEVRVIGDSDDEGAYYLVEESPETIAAMVGIPLPSFAKDS